MSTARDVAKALLQIKAIKLSPQKPFTWASGMRSPIYCDNRIVLSYPEIRKMVIGAFVEKLKTIENIDIIAGVATAGIAHGAMIAAEMDLPFVYVRSKSKAHGRQNQIEGYIEGTPNAFVIEDLISTGGSSLKAVTALRNAGVKVLGVGAIFTYGFEKAKQAFEADNCPFFTLSDYNTLLEEAVASAFISENDQALLQAWRKAPEKWGQ